MLARFRRWRHSLSAALLTAGVMLCVIGANCEPGQAPYDILISLGADSVATGFAVLAYRYLWEQNSQPDQPPEE
jgi:hypothetical protein